MNFQPGLLLLVLILGSAGSPAAAESGDSPFGSSQWPLLLRVAQQVPSFAGPTADERGWAVALTDPSQLGLLRSVLNTDPYWQRFGDKRFPVRRAVKAQFNVIQLVAAAQAIMNLRPDAVPRVDTMLNRVILDGSVSDTDVAALARRAGVTGKVISVRERPRLRVTVTPARLSVKTLNAGPGRSVQVTVRLTNPLDRPAMYSLGCGAEVDLEVLALNGEKVGGVTYGCTLAKRPGLVLQPGQSRIFHAGPHADLRVLPPGRYIWHVLLTDEKILFVLTP